VAVSRSSANSNCSTTFIWPHGCSSRVICRSSGHSTGGSAGSVVNSRTSSNPSWRETTISFVSCRSCDINGQAPTHVLLVPRDHYANAAALAAGDPAASAELLTAAAAVATAAGHDDYRLVYNTGAGVGQTVFHTHLHLLAGRPMTWPPG